MLLLRCYLEGSWFIVRTHHDALRWILNITDATKLPRWRLRQSEFEFQIFYQTSIKHNASDAILCLSTTGMDETPLEDDVPTLMLTKGQPESETPETDAELWPSLPSNDGKDTVKALPPEILQVSDRTVSRTGLRHTISRLHRRLTRTVGKFPSLCVSWDPSICINERESWSGNQK